MRPETILAVLCLLGTFAANAEDRTANNSGTSQRLQDPVDGVLQQIAPTAQSLAAASLTAKQDGTTFRASFVPLRAIDVPYQEILSELKLSFSSDTSTNLTRPAISFAYNPFALRGHRGPAPRKAATPIEQDRIPCKDLLAKKIDELACGLREPWNRCRVKEKKDLLDLARKAAAEGTAAAAAAQKAVIGALVANDGTAAAKAAAAEEAAKLVAVQQAAVHDASDAVDAAKETFLSKKAAKEVDDCSLRLLAAEWGPLNSTWIPMIAATVFIELYPGGSVPDPADPSMKTSVDLSAWGGNGSEVSLSFHAAEVVGVDLYGSYRHARASGAPNTHFAKYLGAGLTASWLFLEFDDRAKRFSLQDYVREGFISGLAAGVSGQFVHCDGQEQCAKLRVDQKSLTPFFDVRISPKAQVRVAIPFAWYSSVDKTGSTVSPTFTFGGTFSGP